jgi:alpha-glucosidase
VVIYERVFRSSPSDTIASSAFSGVDFLKALPATWDDTRFVDGAPSSHTILARRKADAWLVGGMTRDARSASVPLSFLPAGTTYEAAIYRDGADKAALVIDKQLVKRGDVLTVPMLAGGGFAIRLRPATSIQ